MAKRNVKKRDHENLTDSNILKVIKLLGADTPITKKEACEILNISYNVTRLAKIIEEYHEKKAYVKRRKSQLRGKPPTNQEISEIATGYLRGDSFQEISAYSYRSLAFVKSLIQRIGIPSRVLEEEEWIPEYLPENCVKDSFKVGEIAWSAKYHRPVIIEAELSVDYQAEKLGYSDTNYENKYSNKAYRIYVLTEVDEDNEYSKRKPGFNAYSLAYDLGSLSHLEKYGVDLESI
ncbi:MAG: hypothetical protein P8I94_10120 [Emcibacteraceae bacterium]|nr:hypothetical protein [Emcibacteraceae bacterium]